MKRLSITLFSLLVIIATSCVTSLQPLVTFNTAISDKRLEGTWIGDEQTYSVQQFSKSDFYLKNKKDLEASRKENNNQLSEKDKRDSVLISKSYMVKYIKNKVEYSMFGSLIKLNDRYFINLVPLDFHLTDSTMEEPIFNFSYNLGTNSIARVGFNQNNSLKLDFIDGGFLAEQLQTGKMKLKHESDELYDTFLITASTADLQQFLRKYGGDERIFNKENSVTLIRKI